MIYSINQVTCVLNFPLTCRIWSKLGQGCVSQVCSIKAEIQAVGEPEVQVLQAWACPWPHMQGFWALCQVGGIRRPFNMGRGNWTS